jgi:hypothetical protein
MPCVYLPGPAPAVTVANITKYVDGVNVNYLIWSLVLGKVVLVLFSLGPISVENDPFSN